MIAYTLIVLACCHINAAPKDTDSLFKRSVSAFIQTDAVNASIKRIQLFKGAIRESACSFIYDSRQGASYLYSAPSKLRIINLKNALYSIDPVKKIGFRFNLSDDNLCGRADLDPFGRFFTLFSGSLHFTFTGSIDSMSIFHHKNAATGKPDISAGISRTSGNLVLLEFFNSNNGITEQVTFSYDKDSLPNAIVSKSVVGGALLVDSLAIKYKRVPGKIDSGEFKVPEGVSITDK